MKKEDLITAWNEKRNSMGIALVVERIGRKHAAEVLARRLEQVVSHIIFFEKTATTQDAVIEQRNIDALPDDTISGLLAGVIMRADLEKFFIGKTVGETNAITEKMARKFADRCPRLLVHSEFICTTVDGSLYFEKDSICYFVPFDPHDDSFHGYRFDTIAKIAIPTRDELCEIFGAKWIDAIQRNIPEKKHFCEDDYMMLAGSHGDRSVYNRIRKFVNLAEPCLVQ